MAKTKTEIKQILELAEKIYVAKFTNSVLVESMRIAPSLHMRYSLEAAEKAAKEMKTFTRNMESK